jgi:PAS domain S-box-containing protein
MRILHVEEEHRDAELVRQRLRRAGADLELTAAATVSEARARLDGVGALLPDVVLVAARLPDGDGLSLVRHVRGRALPVVVVVITAAGDQEAARAALEAGADDYFGRGPHGLERLPEALEEACRRRRAEAARHSQELLRHRAELSESEARNRAMLRALPDLMFLQDREGVYLDYHARDAGALVVPPSEFLGRRTRDVLPPELAASVETSFAEVLGRDEPTVLEYSLFLGGRERRYEARMVECEHERVLTIVRDVTDRWEAHKAQAENEALFRRLAEMTSAVISIYRDGRLVYINPAGERLTGRSRDELLAMDPWEVVHPEARGALRARIEALEDAGEAPSYELRLRTKAGEDRWAYCTSTVVPFHGQPSVITTAFDITERKRAEEAVRQSARRIQDLAGRLIAAQEEERKRVSRELHDDLNQKVAALGITVSAVKRLLPKSPARLREHVSGLQDRVGELAEDIRRLSHQLHPATLDHIGLVAGLRSYCHEFGRTHGIEVTLAVPEAWPEAPPHVSLCLYRVAQESLHNTARHSGARRVRVTLDRNGEAVRLMVAEHGGRGFDVRQAMRRGGLGLSSMEERVRLLGGSLRVSSRPRQGTEVRAEIPLAREDPDEAAPR